MNFIVSWMADAILIPQESNLRRTPATGGVEGFSTF